MTRIAALDIGSNSVLMCVGEPLEQGDFRVVYESARTTRLGEGMERTGRLSRSAIRRTVRTLEECRRKAEILGVAEGTSKSLVHKARLKIRGYLGQDSSGARQ